MLKLSRWLYVALVGAAARVLIRRRHAFYLFGSVLGTIRYRWGYVGAQRSRRIYLGHLRRALPDFGDAALKNVLRDFWVNHQKSFIELFLLPRLTPHNVDSYVDFEGLNYLDAALAKGRGVVLAAPHFGNERLLHVALALKGYPVTAMTSTFGNAPENLRRARLEPARRVHELVFPDDNPRRLYDALRRNRILQFSPTAPGGTNGTWCDCFGFWIYMSAAPARLALRTGAAFLPAFIYRYPDDRHRIVVEPSLSDAGPNGDAPALTRRLMALVEQRVRDAPGQFYWMWLVIRAQEAAAAGRLPKIALDIYGPQDKIAAPEKI